mmetsp:Transcript_134414/g.268263  ORF Transcript_134414/g.268263 Transcript_134414/m.268263 type:complete len:449 (+) Transcript_134414:122-1468(+)
MWHLILFFGLAVTGVFAEIFEFDDIPMPANTLNSYYVFHVYASAVATKVNANASITFKNFDIKWSDGEVKKGYDRRLQVSLIPWSNFRAIVNLTSFCSSSGQVIFKSHSNGVIIFNPAEQKEKTIPSEVTEEYLLTVTNCDDRNGTAMLKGQVVVKQPHGYLPGNKTWTLHWWSWFTFVNAFLCIMWIVAMACHRRALVYVQKVVAGLAVIAFVEGGVAYLDYWEWNDSGTRHKTFDFVTNFVYSLRYFATLHLLTETASDSGIVVESFPPPSKLKMAIVSAVFLVIQWMWGLVVSNKYCFMIRPQITVAFTVLGALLWLVLYVWFYWQFPSLGTLQDNNLACKGVSVFKFQMVLMGVLLLATVVLLLQLADILLVNTPWNLQWVPYDAAPHAAYTLFLLALMMVWWPRADNWKLEYTDQVNQEEADAAGGEPPMVKAEQIGANEEKL